MPTQPSTADGAEPSGRIVRELLPAAATVLVAALAVVGVALAGSAFVGTATADDTAGLDASPVTEGETTDVGSLAVEPTSADDGSDSDDSANGSTDGSDDSTVVTESDVEATDMVVEPAETDVTVSVDLADGERVTLRIRSDADASPAYLMTEEATVEDGEATAAFDLRQASHGDRATLTVRGNDGLDGEREYAVLVVDESIGVEDDLRSDDDDESSAGDGGSDDDDGSDDEGTDTSVPGFGVVAAVAALLGTALVARRR